jgi:hypothetical protein
MWITSPLLWPAKIFMDQQSQNQSGGFPHNSAPFGTLPNGAEDFRNVPKHSERTESIDKISREGYAEGKV